MLVERNKTNTDITTTKEWQGLSDDAKAIYNTLCNLDGMTKDEVSNENIGDVVHDFNEGLKELNKLGLYKWNNGKLTVYTITPSNHPMVDAFCECYEKYYGVMHNSIDNPERYEEILEKRLTINNLEKVANTVFENKKEKVGVQYFCTGNVIANALKKKQSANIKMTEIANGCDRLRRKKEEDEAMRKQYIASEKSEAVSSNETKEEMIKSIIDAYNAIFGKNVSYAIDTELRNKIICLLDTYTVTDFKNIFFLVLFDLVAVDFEEMFGWDDKSIEKLKNKAPNVAFLLDEYPA